MVHLVFALGLFWLYNSSEAQLSWNCRCWCFWIQHKRCHLSLKDTLLWSDSSFMLERMLSYVCNLKCWRLTLLFVHPMLVRSSFPVPLLCFAAAECFSRLLCIHNMLSSIWAKYDNFFWNHDNVFYRRWSAPQCKRVTCADKQHPVWSTLLVCLLGRQ